MRNRHQTERAARDKLIDLLGFGFTYPLTDLAIADEHLKVPVNQPAEIPIELSQSSVTYRLHDKEGDPLLDDNGKAFEVEGNESEALLGTPPVKKEVTYRIWARKNRHDQRDVNEYAAYLLETAEIKVGLATGLRARILEFPPLDPGIVTPKDSDARLIPFNRSVTVQVDNSQEGVKYQLFRHKEDPDASLSEAIIGLGSNKSIEINSRGLTEDGTIHIRIFRTAQDSDDPDVDSGWLDMTLPVKVRANPDLPVTITPSPVMAFNGTPSIAITGSQASARYRVYLHPVEDDEFVFDGFDPGKHLRQAVPGHEDVLLSKPERKETWLSPPGGYRPASDWKNGNGGPLSIPLDGMKTNSLVIVQAGKQHREGDKTIPSSLQLKQAAILLGGPDPAIPLNFHMPAKEIGSKRSIRVSGGQRGVFYHFRTAEDGEEICSPAYFHKWALDQNQTNRGIERLRLNIDFAVTNTDSPRTPVVDFESLPDNATLHIRARKALTNVTAKLLHPVTVPPETRITPVPVEVELNSTTEIHIEQSKTDVDYQLLLDGRNVGEVKKGNGAVLKLSTGPITKDTKFTVRSLHHLAGDILFELDRIVAVKIKTA